VSDTSSPMKTRQSEEEEGDFWPGDKPKASRSKRLIAVILAVVALAVVAVVVVTLTMGGGGDDTAGAEAGAPPTVWVGTPASEGTAKLNLRTADRRPLTEGEVFTGDVKTVSHGKYSFTLAGSELSADCRAVTWGKTLQDDLRKYGCTQVVRGAYLSQDKRHVGQFIALNLDRLEGADQVVRDLDPQTKAGFVTPLKAPGISTFGSGFSAAYGQSFGHYAIISWVQRNGGGRPDSMNELLDASVAVDGANDFVWQRLVLAGG
jgi:hypothetical protein